MVGKAQDADAVAPEEGIAEPVTASATLMRVAVGFDGEQGCGAEEVGEVGADGVLASELETVESATTQQRPQRDLGGSLGAAQRSRAKGLARECPHIPVSARATSKLRGDRQRR